MCDNTLVKCDRPSQQGFERQVVGVCMCAKPRTRRDCMAPVKVTKLGSRALAAVVRDSS